jgi:hypothetical protein
MRTTGLIGTMLAVTLGAATLAGQPKEPQVPMAVSLKVGTQPYTFTGQGVCQLTPNAGIYEIPATMWSARQQGAGSSVSFTLWHPKAGGDDMFSLGITLNGKSFRTNTAHKGSMGTVVGSGTATFAKNGGGGTFTIDATAGEGARVTGTISCSSFTTPVEDNG